MKSAKTGWLLLPLLWAPLATGQTLERDLEFARALAEQGYFDIARVFVSEKVQTRKNLTPEELVDVSFTICTVLLAEAWNESDADKRIEAYDTQMGSDPREPIWVS